MCHNHAGIGRCYLGCGSGKKYDEAGGAGGEGAESEEARKGGGNVGGVEQGGSQEEDQLMGCVTICRALGARSWLGGAGWDGEGYVVGEKTSFWGC